MVHQILSSVSLPSDLPENDNFMEQPSLDYINIALTLLPASTHTSLLANPENRIIEVFFNAKRKKTHNKKYCGFLKRTK